MNARRRPWRAQFAPHRLRRLRLIACTDGEGRRQAEARAKGKELS